MAVQFNLLPDVKLEFNRQQHAKRLVYTVSSIVTTFVIAITVIAFLSVNVLQKKLLNDANNDITTYSNKLKSIPNLDKVLTIQNQLSALPSLHQTKHVTSRLFDYLPQVTPNNVFIGKLSIDTTANTISITGTADTVESVNKFVDTLKFTQFATKDDADTKSKAFTTVVLSKVDRNERGASYTIDASYDTTLFDATKTVALIVPKETTTRSILNAPDANSTLFNGQTGSKNPSTQGGQ
jgi:Tfp pilus assembly protein PilN